MLNNSRKRNVVNIQAASVNEKKRKTADLHWSETRTNVVNTLSLHVEGGVVDRERVRGASVVYFLYALNFLTSLIICEEKTKDRGLEICLNYPKV